jgi:biotin-(acetyl-CoA carboxylase) ligase
MHLPDPTFPPLLASNPVKSPDRPFRVACVEVDAGRAGAGDVFWARATDLMDVAIILEPEVALEQSTQMPFAAMVALGDALGAIAPPEVGVYYRWPGDIVVNGARAGSVRFAVPRDAAEGAVPRWLVVGATLTIRAGRSAPDPGLDTENTTLEEEGCAGITRTDLIESFCRHFLVWVHNWEQDGFRQISELWVERARQIADEATPDGVTGTLLGLDDGGNLLVKPPAGPAVSLPILAHAVRGGEGVNA